MGLYTTISVSPSSREINGTNAFTVSIDFSISASRLNDTRVEVAGQTYNIGTVTSGSFTWTPPLALLNSMPALTSATVTISGQPANSNNVSLVGRISTYCTVTVPASYVPSKPTSIALTRVDNGVPSSWGVYVQNKSKLSVSWSAASGTGGATISQYRIYTDAGSGYYTATGTSITNLGPFTAGTKTVTVVAVDSRGRTATSTGVAYEVLPYTVPAVSTYKVDRTTSTGVVDNLAAYMKASLTYAFASVGGKNSASAKFAYKAASSGTYSAETAIAQSTPVIFGGSFSSTVAYHVRFTVTDALGTVTTYVATVDSLKIALEFESSGTRMWARCPTTIANTLAVDGAATFNDLITSGGNSHLLLNGASYISLRTGGTERGYFHSGGLHVPGTISCANLSVTNPPWPSLPTNPTFTTVNVSQDANAYTVNGYSLLDIGSNGIRTSARVNYGLRTNYACSLFGADYVQFFVGSTERGYFHSGGLNVTNTISCANLSVTNPPWPTSVSLPANISCTSLSASSYVTVGTDNNAYRINGYSMLDLGNNAQRYSARMNYGLRSNYAATIYAADYVQFYIGNTERAYCSTSGLNNSSRAEQKADIREADSALSIIKEATLYKYHYTVPPVEKQGPVAQAVEDCAPERAPAEPAPSPERLGFVIGEGYDPPPDCVLAEDGNGINLYSMISVCWKAIQELSAKMEGGKS